MNTLNQISKIQITLYVVLSLLSAICGVIILITVSGFIVIPVIFIIILILFLILSPEKKTNHKTGTIERCTSIKKSILVITALLTFSFAHAQRVGIGTTTPNAAAQLDVSSTSKGFLPPRMTLIQRNAIPNPVAGLTVWCTTCEELSVYNGTKWTNAIGGPSSANVGVVICNQIWQTRNLDVATFNNGDPIPLITNLTDWLNTQGPAYCYYNFDPANGPIYGKLYNFFAVLDGRGLAPAGYRIPSRNDFEQLIACTGGHLNSNAVREAGTAHWVSPNTGATNSSGFTALPAGHFENRPATVAYFHSLGSKTAFWTSEGWLNPTMIGGYNYEINYASIGGIWQYVWAGTSENFRAGLSIRCIKN
jgi:uncharacterized protein (TIGR02145 family)